jgi:hypothetical protein
MISHQVYTKPSRKKQTPKKKKIMVNPNPIESEPDINPNPIESEPDMDTHKDSVHVDNKYKGFVNLKRDSKIFKKYQMDLQRRYLQELKEEEDLEDSE